MSTLQDLVVTAAIHVTIHRRVVGSPVWMLLEIFCDIHRLPAPVPSEEQHYALFSDVYSKHTTEEHQAHLQAKKGRNPFTVGVQLVKNVAFMEECEEHQVC